jgi:dihydroorotate dehydrogenase (NAD+) catalytic subunit
MITFRNGYKLDFACASGALGFDGNGWLWEKPLRWSRILRPSSFTIITKTLTLHPRKGNLNLWKPWECVALIPGGAVNAVGLTNTGLHHWMARDYPVARSYGYDLIVSICPYNAEQARIMAGELHSLRDIVGIEVNLSCPNVSHEGFKFDPVEVVEAVRSNTDHLVIAKVGIDQLEVCEKLDPMVDAFDAINSVLWSIVFPNEPSPLAKYGLVGAVSGASIREYAMQAVEWIRRHCTKPVISGGGIGSVNEVYARRVVGAGAVTLGVQTFLRQPWLANLIVDVCRGTMGDKNGKRQECPMAERTLEILARRLPSLYEGGKRTLSSFLCSTGPGRPGSCPGNGRARRGNQVSGCDQQDSRRQARSRRNWAWFEGSR